MTDPFAVIPVKPKKKCILHKCSTCADRQCRVRGKVVDWTHCPRWAEKKKIASDCDFEGR